ncbi:hypothetical protein [Aquimarina hainanensis]
MMKTIVYIFLAIFLLGCANTDNNTEAIHRIKSGNFRVFKNIMIQARNHQKDKPIAYFFTKEINKKKFLLPNLSLFNCKLNDSTCFKKHTNKKFDIDGFIKASNIKNNNDVHQYTYNFIKEVITEYEKTGVQKIISNSDIGNCIIFYLNEKYFLAYVPEISNVYNVFWKNSFNDKNKIDKYWYSGSIPATSNHKQ